MTKAKTPTVSWSTECRGILIGTLGDHTAQLTKLPGKAKAAYRIDIDGEYATSLRGRLPERVLGDARREAEYLLARRNGQ